MSPEFLKEKRPDLYEKYKESCRLFYKGDEELADELQFDVKEELFDLFDPSENDLDDLTDFCERELGILI